MDTPYCSCKLTRVRSAERGERLAAGLAAGARTGIAAAGSPIYPRPPPPARGNGCKPTSLGKRSLNVSAGSGGSGGEDGHSARAELENEAAAGEQDAVRSSFLHMDSHTQPMVSAPVLLRSSDSWSRAADTCRWNVAVMLR